MLDNWPYLLDRFSMQFSNPSNQFASLAVLIAAAIWGLYWIPLRYLAGLGMREDWVVALINIPAAFVALTLFLWQLRSSCRICAAGL